MPPQHAGVSTAGKNHVFGKQLVDEPMTALGKGVQERLRVL